LIRIRLATTADAPLLPQIEQSAGRVFRDTVHAWVADDPSDPPEAYLSAITAGDVLIAQQDGAVAGFVRVGQEGGELHVFELDVIAGRQKQGVGTALMAAARTAAIARGCSAMTLTTFSNIPFNAPFYARLGFVTLDAPGPRLAAILAREAERGLTDRCAMRAAL
jgi:GNAT superfamily N-acetyltransferase